MLPEVRQVHNNNDGHNHFTLEHQYATAKGSAQPAAAARQAHFHAAPAEVQGLAAEAAGKGLPAWRPRCGGNAEGELGLGGVADWQTEFPKSCALTSPWKPCAWFCDAQSCDQCHPDNNGYTQLAMTVKAGLGL